MSWKGRGYNLVSSALKIPNGGATRTPDRGRQLAVGLSLGFVILVLIGQLFRYQIVEHAYLKQAAIQQRSWEKTSASRKIANTCGLGSDS